MIPSLGSSAPTPHLKKVRLSIEDPAFGDLLQVLLREWGYTLCDGSGSDSLLLISAGRQRPADSDHILTLNTSKYHNLRREETPLNVESLYLTLENHFHSTPRNHIRINLRWPIRVRARGQEFTTHTVTVADRGIRFLSPFEFAHQEEMEISIEGADQSYELHARAVYSIMGREIGRGDQIEVGAVCTPQSKEVRDRIRQQIIDTYLRRARALLDDGIYSRALQQLARTRISAVVSRTIGERY